jgi:hypothetical protein
MDNIEMAFRIERRLDEIERILRKLLSLEYEECQEEHTVRTLNLEIVGTSPINKKPPTQGIGVDGTDQGSVMKPGAAIPETDDMKVIKRLVGEPYVRKLLFDEAKIHDVPEQVQHQRVLAERIVLGVCGAKTYPELAEGEPAKRLAQLVHKLAVLHVNLQRR